MNLTPLVIDEKAVRAQIYALLVSAGIPKGDGVTCAGYDVLRRGKKGNTTINADKLTANGQFKSPTWLQYLGQLYAFLPLWPDPHHTGVTLQRRQRLSHISPIHFLLDG